MSRNGSCPFTLTVSSTPPSTPTSTKPRDSIMDVYGGTFANSGVRNRRVGRKLSADWSGLDTSHPVQTTTKHYKPINPLYDSKAYELRTKGLPIKLSKSSDITNF